MSQVDSGGGHNGLFAKFNSPSQVLSNLVLPLLDLGIRLWVAQVFFTSGLAKIKSMSTTIALFENEYSVPLLSPEVAAYLAAGAELFFPVLLFAGLAGRFAGLGLFVLNLVAWHSYANTDFASTAGHIDHFVWMLMLAYVVARGPGKLSVDHFVKKWWRNRQ